MASLVYRAHPSADRRSARAAGIPRLGAEIRFGFRIVGLPAGCSAATVRFVSPHSNEAPLLRSGRGLVHPSGPTDTPERVLRAFARASVDFGTADFAELVAGCLDELARMPRTRGRVYAYAAPGHGAREAAPVNPMGPGELMGPGETVPVPEAGRFAMGWAEMVEALGIRVVRVPTDKQRPVDLGPIEAAHRLDRKRRIRCMLAVHVETSTGIRHDPRTLRVALDAACHPALLVVDAIAPLASIRLETDAWRIDGGVAGSQKGLVLPPGLSFVAARPCAPEVARTAGLPRRDWDRCCREEADSSERFSGTPPVPMIFALRGALDIPAEEGSATVFARHPRLAGAVRAAVARRGASGAIDVHCLDPDARADTGRALAFAPEVELDRRRERARERHGVGLGGAIGPFRGRLLRIGHLVDLDEAMVPGALGVLELVLRLSGVPHGRGGVGATVAALAGR